ncbi:hypothetical protein GCM10009823_32730 [Brevibacterium salitolerans]|uniref:Uncharacterized protein n=1 Tax=Brevibacterium salitolerans TaxID=1403566 RepID=A0ABN2X8J8_9MICO
MRIADISSPDVCGRALSRTVSLVSEKLPEHRGAPAQARGACRGPGPSADAAPAPQSSQASPANLPVTPSRRYE